MSSTDGALETDPERPAESSSDESTIPVPKHPAFYAIVALGFALILAGVFLASGEMMGLLGLWGLSAIAAAVLVYVAYGIWYYLG